MHSEDSLPTVQQKIAAGEAMLVDVREQAEWDDGHVAGAIFLPLSELGREDGIVTALAAERLPADKIIYTHCHLGVRSLSAAEILRKLGYQVRPLGPGYDDLIAAEFQKAGK
jgi:rhodanese-related sulfurtransferase